MALRYCRALNRAVASAVRPYHTLSNERSLQLLHSYGVPIPSSLPAYTADEAVSLAAEFASPISSDGKSSDYSRPRRTVLSPVSSTIPPNTPATYAEGNMRYGHHVLLDPEQIRSVATTMLGSGPVLSVNEWIPLEDDWEVKKVLVSKYHSLSKTFMLAIMVDRKECCPVLLVSSSGAIKDMESHLVDRSRSARQVARFKLPYGKDKLEIPSEVMSELGGVLKMGREETARLRPYVQAAYNLFRYREAILVEINPFMITKEGNFLAVDARIVADSSALFRQAMLKPPPSPPLPPELAPKASEMAYVTLPNPTATIGTIVNGAGLAMATNDTLKHYGGEAANFCDFGGRATAETILEAFRKVLADKRVNTILVNVYGGITQCDMIAQAILEAVKAASDKADMVQPVVVRLAGTGAKQGMERIRTSGLGLYAESTFEAAAKKAIELSKQEPMKADQA